MDERIGAVMGCIVDLYFIKKNSIAIVKLKFMVERFVSHRRLIFLESKEKIK